MNAVSLNKPVSWRKTRERRKRRRAQGNRYETRVIQPLLIEPYMKRPMCHSVRAPCVSDAATTGRTAGSMTRTRVPEILMDCFFARRDDETETVTLLVVEGPLLRAIQAWVVEGKGSDLDAADVLQRAVKGLRSFGHRERVVNKADNERHIKEEILRRREVGAIPVESVSMIRKTTALMKFG